MSDSEPLALCEARALALWAAVETAKPGEDAWFVERNAKRFLAFLTEDEPKED